jgi:hypothetical protein
MKDIEKAVKGFGLHPGWREKKEKSTAEPAK